MWVLGLYKLSWPANGSFKYVDMFFCLFVCLFVFFCLFFLFCFVFCFFVLFCLFFCFFLVGGGRQECKG